jgi:hypothetical protein
MASGDATISALSNILKTKYDQKTFYQLFYRKAPLIGAMRKDEKFGGNNARISLRYGSPQGGSLTFTNAQTNKTSSSDAGFLLTRVKDYQVSGISGEALAAADGDENTLYNGLKGEMEGSMRNLNRSMQIQSYRNGGGQRGKGNSAWTITGNVVTLSVAADITNFEVSMWCDFAADDGYNNGSPTSVRAGGPVQITALDRTAGTITFGNVANLSVQVPAIANSDYLFRNGDYSLGVSGIASWTPDTAPSSTAFFGVDRSKDVVRLGGVRYNGNGGNKEETLIDAAELVSREGADDLTCFMNNLDRADIVKSLGSKAMYDVVKSTDGTWGYKALVIEGPDGPIKLVSEVNCPRGFFKLLQMDTWVMKSIRGAPRLLDDDGNKMLRESNNDGYEWRMGAYWQIGCEAPGYNLAGTF